ncbi:MAG: 4-hydroxythreonine-4-phosphate dehydrogenase, partial [Enhydrobacter sp.]
MTTASLPLAVTMGEPAGIGGELTLKAWLARQPRTRPFFALDDPIRLVAITRQLGLDVPVREIAAPAEAASAFAKALPGLPGKLR